MNDYFKLNPVFSDLRPSSTLLINESVNDLWQRAEQVFHMGFGESRFDVHAKLQAALCEHANKKSYLPARGLPQLCEAVASYYSHKLGVEFKPSQVIIGPGSKSLIYGLQMALDADVFLPTPSWVSYAPQAALLNKRCFYIPSKVEENYQLDIAALDKLVKQSKNPCKMLIINSPNNPTGEVWSAEFVQQLADYCRANQIWVLSDEIYFEVCHGETEHVSISNYYPEGTFVLGGLSKHLSIGGWRVGVALLPNTRAGSQLMQKLLVLGSETWSGVSAPIQYGAIQAYQLDTEIENYIGDCRQLHGIRTRYIRDALQGLGVRSTSGNGAFYLTVNFDDYRSDLKALGVASSVDLANYLLEQHKIATLPGIDFGIPEQTLSLRLSTSYLDMESDADSQRLMALYRSKLSPQEIMSIGHHPNTHAAVAEFSAFLNSVVV